MALRQLPLPTGFATKTERKGNVCDARLLISGGKSRPNVGFTVAINSSLNNSPRKEKGVHQFPDLFPLEVSEESSSRFRRQITILELERLFRETGDSFLQPHDPAPPDGFYPGRPLRIVYQGVRGSYCQEAALNAFPSESNDFSPCFHMDEAFRALEEKAADRAIAPFENSIDGPIDRNLDLLLRHQGVEIVGEHIIPVNHCLLAPPEASMSGIRRILSHPQALSHCKGRLHATLVDQVEIEEVANSADAARFISENGVSDTAVIGSKIAAREFGLRVLEENFQDDDRGGIANFNRFLELARRSDEKEGTAPAHGQGRRSSWQSGMWKTTVAFSLENGVSDLWRALWAFERRQVRVTRVGHRPDRGKSVREAEEDREMAMDDSVCIWSRRQRRRSFFDYVFVLDVEGSITSDPGVKAAVAELKEVSAAGFVGVLGSYATKTRH